ncbi:MAG TPA: universal stress protein [Solirubrobacteraceae bacterium]|nr:universal stress protein [Solirubrobacteraceae bacterium]
MIVIAYDGSTDAQAAVRQAAALMPGHAAIVLAVEERSVDAESRAREGAELGHEFGIDCRARTRPRRGTVAATIAAEARDAGADAIVIGRRGRRSAPPRRLGSVCETVLAEAPVAVLVVSTEGSRGLAMAATNSRAVA